MSWEEALAVVADAHYVNPAVPARKVREAVLTAERRGAPWHAALLVLRRTWPGPGAHASEDFSRAFEAVSRMMVLQGAVSRAALLLREGQVKVTPTTLLVSFAAGGMSWRGAAAMLQGKLTKRVPRYVGPAAALVAGRVALSDPEKGCKWLSRCGRGTVGRPAAAFASSLLGSLTAPSTARAASQISLGALADGTAAAGTSDVVETASTQKDWTSLAAAAVAACINAKWDSAVLLAARAVTACGALQSGALAPLDQCGAVACQRLLVNEVMAKATQHGGWRAALQLCRADEATDTISVEVRSHLALMANANCDGSVSLPRPVMADLVRQLTLSSSLSSWGTFAPVDRNASGLSLLLMRLEHGRHWDLGLMLAASDRTWAHHWQQRFRFVERMLDEAPLPPADKQKVLEQVSRRVRSDASAKAPASPQLQREDAAGDGVDDSETVDTINDALVVVTSDSGRTREGTPRGVELHDAMTWDAALAIVALRIARGRVTQTELITAMRRAHDVGRWQVAARLVAHFAVKEIVPLAVPPIAASVALRSGQWFAAADVLVLLERSAKGLPTAAARHVLRTTAVPLLMAARNAGRWKEASCIFAATYGSDTQSSPAAVVAATLGAMTHAPSWENSLNNLMCAVPHATVAHPLVNMQLIQLIARHNPQSLSAAIVALERLSPATLKAPKLPGKIMQHLSQSGLWERVLMMLRRPGGPDGAGLLQPATADGHEATGLPMVTPDRPALMSVLHSFIAAGKEDRAPPPAVAAVAITGLINLGREQRDGGVDVTEAITRKLFQYVQQEGVAREVLLPALAKWRSQLTSWGDRPPPASHRTLVVLAAGLLGQYGEVAAHAASGVSESTYETHQIATWAEQRLLPGVSTIRHRVSSAAGSGMALTLYANRYLALDVDDIAAINGEHVASSTHLERVTIGDVLTISVSEAAIPADELHAVAPPLVELGHRADAASHPCIVAEKPVGVSTLQLGTVLPRLPMRTGSAWTPMFLLDPAECGLTVWRPAQAPRRAYRLSLVARVLVEPISRDEAFTPAEKLPAALLRAEDSTFRFVIGKTLPLTQRVLAVATWPSAENHYSLAATFAAQGWRIVGMRAVAGAADEQAAREGRQDLRRARRAEHLPDRGCCIQEVHVWRRGQQAATVTIELPGSFKRLWDVLCEEERAAAVVPLAVIKSSEHASIAHSMIAAVRAAAAVSEPHSAEDHAGGSAALSPQAAPVLHIVPDGGIGADGAES
jgi:hypothetical protein